MVMQVNDIARWMSDLPDNKKLYEICMPASHDAGLYEVTATLKTNDHTKIITQDHNIKQQLKYGVRFFDLRVYEYARNDLRVGHFFEFFGKRHGHADAGGFGPSIDVIFQDVMEYMGEDGMDEVVFLRLSHIKKSVAGPLVEKCKHYFSDFLYKGLTTNMNLAAGRISDMRGKVIPICDPKAFADYINPIQGIYSFAKSHGKGAHLVTTGSFTGKKSYQKMHDDQLEKLRALRDKRDEVGLSKPFMGQLYWTLTGGNIKDNTTKNLFYETNNTLPQFLRTFKPNIVLYDFCNGGHSTVIVKHGND